MRKAILIIGVFVIVLSCRKDDIPPSITALNLNMNDTIRNVYSIELEATDNEGVHKIELYIDDLLVTEDEKIPFVFSWNTLDIDDGKHSVRLEVSDAEGNKTESLSNVFVNNNLLVVNAGALYYFPHYIVVSDEEGNVLDTAILKRNTITVLKPEKPYEGNSINFIWLMKGQGVSTMSGYVHIRRGSEFNLKYWLDPITFKDVKLHLKNDIPSFSEILISSDLHSKLLKSISDTVQFAEPLAYTAGYKILVQLLTDRGRFYRFFEIGDKPEITINLSTITSPQVNKTITFPAEGEASYSIIGKARETDLNYGYNISNTRTNYTGNTLELWFPGEYLISFNTWLSYHKYGTPNYYSDIYNGEIPSGYMSNEADLQIVNPSAGAFSATFSGMMDFYTIDFKNEDRSIQFSVNAPFSCHSWKLPDPGSVFNDNDFSLSRYRPELIRISDFESLDFSDNFYDLSIDIQKLSRIEPHYQMVFISLFR